MRNTLIFLIFLFQANLLTAVPASKPKKFTASRAAKAPGKKPAARQAASRSKKRPAGPRLIAGGPWREPTYADSTLGDVVDGEDLLVRRAAVDALGPYNGSVVVADPQTGRILTIVNQKLALGSGFQPCSTVKIVTAIAGLKEGIIERNTQLRLGRRSTMNLTDALAHSNNPFFARVGTDLGFERVHSYAKLLGLGEKAGLNIEGEFPGVLTPEPPKFGGVGMMTSFGEGIQLTALQLAALLSAIANGGTLYHLQYPRTKEEIANFAPRVKRHLDIQDQIPDVKPGMMAAVDYGTGRRANYDPSEPILGKTGTCTDRATPTHLGWFGSFNEVGRNKLVVVVLLTGGRTVNGPVAAEVAGSVYRNLSSQQFFAVAAQ
ncbi:MAG: penicillin-binding transpeptidase domain-containing protein [Acidobacteria bacterium]|nr:penicillin-binding transpeptidase domain-containing protein [Acidobacteriota bacterium]